MSKKLQIFTNFAKFRSLFLSTRSSELGSGSETGFVIGYFPGSGSGYEIFDFPIEDLDPDPDP